MLRLLYTVLCLITAWHKGIGVQLFGQIDKIFSVINNEEKGCHVDVLPETIDWCNDTLNSYDLLPDFTSCQTNDPTETDLQCRKGIWWRGKSPMWQTVRVKRSGIQAVLDLERGHKCNWICARNTDFFGKTPPVFDYCPSSTTLYPVANSTSVAFEWQEPTAVDQDGNVTSLQKIIGPQSSSTLQATTTPGTIYHVSYMAMDDDKLKWPCYFTVECEIPVCPAIVNFRHGEYSCDKENSRGSRCTFKCDEGYFLNTSDTTYCQDDGTWSFGDYTPECLASPCGEITANFTDVNFICHENSYVFGSLCWARCNYGYILRNDEQEEEEIAALKKLKTETEARLNRAQVAKSDAEEMLKTANETLYSAKNELEIALSANASAAEEAKNAETELNHLKMEYNESLTLAKTAMDDAEAAASQNSPNAPELLSESEILTSEAEGIAESLRKANETFYTKLEVAEKASMEAVKANNNLMMATESLHEAEDVLKNKTDEEDAALNAYTKALEKLNTTETYVTQSDRIINTYAKCETGGTWTIPGKPFCIDTEPPMLKCIPIHTLYIEPGKSSVPGSWPRPTVQAAVKGTAEVHHQSGPTVGTALGPGQYVVEYFAIDTSANISPVCSMVINVEVYSCRNILEVITDKNIMVDCDSYTAGSSCTVSCKNPYVLWGDDRVTCMDDPTTEEIDVKWNFDNSSCIAEHCPALAEPANGNITCEKAAEGDRCEILCDKGYILPYKTPSFFYCGGAGVWSPETVPSECIESGETQVAIYTFTISYLSSNECYKFELEDQRLALETTITSHLKNFPTCDEGFECMMGRTDIDCNEEEELVKFTLSIVITCPDDTDIHCNLALNIIDDLEKDLRSSIDVDGIFDHLNFTMLEDSWLEATVVDIPTCSSGSILVRANCEKCDIGSFLDPVAMTCVSCPMGTYGDTPGLVSCKSCPHRTNTATIGSTSAKECRDLCAPGSYSDTTMIPCNPCEAGTFQPDFGGTQCQRCPSGKWTTISGADSMEKCIAFDMYFEKEFLAHDVGIDYINGDMSAIFWVKGFDIPRFTFGLHYELDATDFAFKIAIEETIHLFSDSWDDTPTDIEMSANEWTMLAVVWEEEAKVLKIYKNGELAYTMTTKDDSRTPTRVVLSVKEETFLSGFVVFPYVVFPNIIQDASRECGTLPGFHILSMLADLRQSYLRPVPSTCQASTATVHDNCGNHWCQNNGVCVHSDTIGYTCNCTDDYGGHFCEKSLVHGDWSEWKEAAGCSVSCGTGVRSVYRLCNNPAPGLYGKDCEGNSTDLVECQMEDCRVCEDLPSEDGTVCLLEDEECTPACKEGRVLPRGQLEQKFRCGVSTNYEWVPVNRAPLCARVMKPQRYGITGSFEVRPEIPCEHLSDIVELYEEKAAGLTCPSQNPNCVSAVIIDDCSRHRLTRAVPTTPLKLEFAVTLTVEGDFDLEKYFETRNITDSIMETVQAIYDLEGTIQLILDLPTTLDVVFNNVTYTIVPGSAQIAAVTTCRPLFIDTQGLCVQCQRGTQLVNGWCVYCDRGTYQDSEGQAECIPCPEGKTTDFVGARSEDDCKAIITDGEPSPSTSDIGSIIIIAICAVGGIVLTIVVVCTILKFYITSKRRRQYDMEAETTSLYTDFPDIAYNMYFKNRQVLGFDEKGIPIIAHDENDDAQSPFLDNGYPFANKEGEVLPPLIPPVEPFSFSARPIQESPFYHPPPKLKKQSFMKPSMDPIKQFNFPDMREIPVRFKVPKRKRFQNKYPRHTFGLDEEETGYISKTVPIPKNATRLLYKSPTGENLYAYLFKDGLIRTVGPVSELDDEGMHPDLPLLKAQYLQENGFEHIPPVFEKLKTGDEPKSRLGKKRVGSSVGGRSLDSRPSTAKPGSRPSTTKSKSRSLTSPRANGSPRSRGSQRSRGSPRSRGPSHLESSRSTSSVESPRAKSALLGSGSRSAKSVSIRENGHISRPSTAATSLSRPKSSAFSDGRLINTAETYRPKSINISESPRQVLPAGTPMFIPTTTLDDQMSNGSIPQKDQKMKLFAPPFSKARPKSVTPDIMKEGDKDISVDTIDTKDLDTENNQKEVRFDDEIEEDELNVESEHDSDSSGSVIYTKRKDSGKRIPDASRASMTSIPKPIIPEGTKVLRKPKDFIESLNLPMPPRSHQMEAMVQPPSFLKSKAVNTETKTVDNVGGSTSTLDYNTF